MFTLGKFSLIIITRCNLRCRLCCEYVPQHSPFPDMTVEEERKILNAAFAVADHISTLHLTGGGEPFLHKDLSAMIRTAMEYASRFDKLMLFTNCTIPIPEPLLETMSRCRDKLLVQVSRYGLYPDKESEILRSLTLREIPCKVVKYYGEEQDFGGWVDFGPWDAQGQATETLKKRFASCAVTKAMNGNWRTRDGKVHWCSRSQRGMDLGRIPNHSEDYVDLLDERESVEEKRRKFREIAERGYLTACDYCSGNQGTDDSMKRFPAGEQEKRYVNL